VVFFLAPALLMVGASFQQPGDFGGLVPALQNGQSTLSLETYRFFFGDWIYAEIFGRSFLVAGHHPDLPAAGLSAGLADRPQRQRHRDLLVLLVILPWPATS
jgi:spermidine/putrescine transport system permease protein